MKRWILTLALVLFASIASAETILVSPSVYDVDEGVAFSIGNSGFSSFLFSWSDGGGTFQDVPDPTLILTAGQTYTFTRTSSSHPFVITDSSLPVTGTPGNYNRDTFDGAIIDTSGLQPLSEFTADPAPTSDFITWTPGTVDEGNYYYTCRVTSHVGMTGAIEVQIAAVPVETGSFSAVKAIYE